MKIIPLHYKDYYQEVYKSGNSFYDNLAPYGGNRYYSRYDTSELIRVCAMAIPSWFKNSNYQIVFDANTDTASTHINSHGKYEIRVSMGFVSVEHHQAQLKPYIKNQHDLSKCATAVGFITTWFGIVHEVMHNLYTGDNLLKDLKSIYNMGLLKDVNKQKFINIFQCVEDVYIEGMLAKNHKHFVRLKNEGATLLFGGMNTRVKELKELISQDNFFAIKLFSYIGYKNLNFALPDNWIEIFTLTDRILSNLEFYKNHPIERMVICKAIYDLLPDSEENTSGQEEEISSEDDLEEMAGDINSSRGVLTDDTPEEVSVSNEGKTQKEINKTIDDINSNNRHVPDEELKNELNSLSEGNKTGVFEVFKRNYNPNTGITFTPKRYGDFRRLIRRIITTYEKQRDRVNTLSKSGYSVVPHRYYSGSETYFNRIAAPESIRRQPMFIVLGDLSGSTSGSLSDIINNIMYTLHIDLSSTTMVDYKIYGHTTINNNVLLLDYETDNTGALEKFYSSTASVFSGNADGSVIKYLLNKHSDREIVFIMISDGLPTESLSDLKPEAELKDAIDKANGLIYHLAVTKSCKRNAEKYYRKGFVYDLSSPGTQEFTSEMLRLERDIIKNVY